MNYVHRLLILQYYLIITNARGVHESSQVCAQPKLDLILSSGKMKDSLLIEIINKLDRDGIFHK